MPLDLVGLGLAATVPLVLFIAQLWIRSRLDARERRPLGSRRQEAASVAAPLPVTAAPIVEPAPPRTTRAPSSPTPAPFRFDAAPMPGSVDNAAGNGHVEPAASAPVELRR